MILFRRYGTLLGFFLIVIFFWIQRPDTFMTARNWLNITQQVSILCVVSFTMTIVMVGGDFDLSVGSMASLTGIIGAVLMQQGSPILVAIGVSILAGLAGGILNGLLVAYARLSAFVATLGTLTLFGGLALLTSDGKTLFGRSIPEAVGNFGRGSLLLFEDISVPYLTLIALVVLILVGILLRQTIVGRQLHAVGGNQEASRLAGIPVAKLRVMAFAINGIGAAVAGLMLVSRL